MAHPGMPAAMSEPRLRLMTLGSVDDGKSTLIGRLLYDSGAVYEDHLVEVSRAAGKGDIDFSFLVDGLKAEREQGITIDVAYRYFATQRRSFLIADAPGHEQYTRNQAAAASHAQLGIVLVTATDGVQPQTRRHMAIAALFGLSHVVVAINKMDLVGFDRAAFAAVAEDMRRLAAGLGLQIVATIPVAAKAGANVVQRGDDMAWYEGPSLLGCLESFSLPAPVEGPAILPVQHTLRIEGGGRISCGTLASGQIRPGDPLVTDGGQRVHIAELWSAGRPVECAQAGEAIAVRLNPERDIGRGAVLTAPSLQAGGATQLRVRLVWLVDYALQSGRTYQLQIGTSGISAHVSRIEGILDLATMAVTPSDKAIGVNDLVIARFSLLAPAPALPFAQNRALGAFILVDRASARTVAAGVVLGVERRDTDTPWQALEVSPERRASLLGQKPCVLWLTGLSGAGKSTLANLVDRELFGLGRPSVILDGDNLRHGLNADLGFSDADRIENIRRVAFVAAMMADAGLLVIVSLLSPFEEARRHARQVIGENRFIEIFVDAPLDVCRQRDPKGLYARADAGTLQRFTGVATGYEPPTSPDLHLHTDQIEAAESGRLILDMVRRRGFL